MKLDRSSTALGVWLLMGGIATTAPPAVNNPADGRPAVATRATGQLTLSADHAEKMTRGLELFKTQISGLITTHCLKCHGGKKTEGELDLSSREGLLRGGSEGPAIVLGKSRESLLYKLISHADEPGMPYETDKLPDEAIAQFAAWIDSGAPYDKPLVAKAGAPKGRPTVSDEDRQFWSFVPLAQVASPEVANASWCRTPIDRFILAPLEAKQLAPSPAVDRRKLIRRATFDLIGLPPTPAEVEVFVNDTSPDAYEKVVDRLLANPHYGERWARHWLDLARFAESHGYEQDYDRPSAYHFRDFVIRALNDDMPYDHFVALQIAGDELAPDDPQALMATGYLGAGTHATQITANQVEKERYDELDDMTATIGTSMLGLTVGCARCHDHKFDPIPQTDYYRLLSTFTTTVRSEMDLDLHPERYREAKAKFDTQHAPLADALARFERDELPARFERWLESNPQPPRPCWLVLDGESAKSAGGATLARQPDGSYLVGGTNPKSDDYTFVAHTALKNVTALRLEALADPSLKKGGPGRADNGNFALSDFRVSVGPGDGMGEAREVTLANPRATFEQAGLPVAAAIDDDKKSGWAVDPQFGRDHAAVFELAEPLDCQAGATLTFRLHFDTNTGHGIGRLRLSLSTGELPAPLDGDCAQHDTVIEVARILSVLADQRTAADVANLRKWFATTDADWQKLSAAVAESLKSAPKPELTKVLVCSEGVPAIRLHTQGADFLDKTHILKRGDPNQKQDEATQSFLQALMTAPDREQHWKTAPPEGWRTSYRRRSLANWITDVDQGAGRLLARVIVNRLWQHHFGRGIVATPSDFGAQGERPTHPELLDWLAGELVREGWRLKPLHRQMMTSAAYMQGNSSEPPAVTADPDNRLVGRRTHQRLEAEAIRDSMLAVSGVLDAAMFGPGTLDQGMRRRSIYFTVKRSQLIPMMTLFDAPDSLQGLGSRGATTVAPQALAMMNNAQIQEYARAMARRLQAEATSGEADAIGRGYLLALGRPPAAEEVADAQQFLKTQRESYIAAGKSAASGNRVAGDKGAAGDDGASGNKSDAAELALADFCQALFCLNEFMFVE